MTTLPAPLGAEPRPGPNGGADFGKRQPPRRHPVMGYCAIGFGVLGVITHGYVFTPIGFVCSLIALFLGQMSWAFVGFFLTVVGIATSPILLALFGLGFLAKFLAVS